MRKRFTKIICAVTASTFILGAVAVAGCSEFYNAPKLDGDYTYTGKAGSNGGFAVEAGNYVYYINGIGDGTALNDFGKPVKGAVYRISKDNLKQRKYSDVQRVVPSIAYSTDYNAGIFIYGDRIYYGTPSTAKNSEGVVQNSYLDMKSSKLDGTETKKDAYVSFPAASYEYRFVEEGGTVYLLYVATDEKLYEESTGVTNLHSYNTATGEDTLLAYNVLDVTFDSEDKTNPRVYYTMSVYDYTGSSNTAYGYNQLYTVTASATEDKFAEVDKSTIDGWNEDEDEGDVDRYINCGDLVLDGIGYTDYLSNGKQLTLTPFNTGERNKNVTNDLSYTYTVRQYVDDKVYYTRTTSLNSSAHLFALADLKDGEKPAPIANNPDADDKILLDGSEAGGYKFVEVDGKPAVLCAESSGGITINYFDEDDKLGDEASDLYEVEVDGNKKLNTYYPVVKDGTATILHVDTENNYLYYSVSDSNYTVYRVDYTGDPKDYNAASLDAVDNEGYKAVQILDLKASSGWYMPEFISDYIFFASSTTDMSALNYVMVFDLHKYGATDLMTNADITALNDKYEGIEKNIKEVFGDTDKYPVKTYANLQNALRYAFYNGDYDYLIKYAEELNEELEEDADPVYSDETIAEYENFCNATGNVWEKEYGGDNYRTVNGNKVYANSRDYYYALLGEMAEEDKEAYAEGLQTSYLVAKAEEEPAKGWYEGLSTVEKVFFVIGMCLIGALVIGGGVWLTLFLLKRRNKQPEERRRRIKVDTTDDKSVDVYDYQE